MTNPDRYRAWVGQAQLTALTGGDPAVLAAAEAAAAAEIEAALAHRYDLAPFRSRSDGTADPDVPRPAELDRVWAELTLAHLLARRATSVSGPISTAARQRAEAARAWLAGAARGDHNPGLPPRQTRNPLTGAPEPLPLLGGSHPRIPLDRNS